jgi:MOSC domain-containing protein YiiM
MPVDHLELTFAGVVGDRHFGETMASDTRQSKVYARGTTIRNHRQASIVDMTELAAIATRMGIPLLEPGVIADNICTSGISDLTSLRPMTRMEFSRGAVVIVGGENFPCVIAGGLVHDAYGTRAESFPKAAMGLRGVTGWVDHPGFVRAGDSITLHPPL